ncbi:MAG: hypothetical protein H5T86_01855 [Armatimonadetes bacterium]|nr:hypothetical protein [Armatimonadota bacterium]
MRTTERREGSRTDATFLASLLRKARTGVSTTLPLHVGAPQGTTTWCIGGDIALVVNGWWREPRVLSRASEILSNHNTLFHAACAL